MTDTHPITPPPELVQQWRRSGPADAAVNNAYERHIATQAARWGWQQRDASVPNELQEARDEELEACCQEVHNWYGNGNRLRAARRPKPPSLKEQALAELELLRGDANAHGLGFDAPAIRRALEALPE